MAQVKELNFEGTPIFCGIDVHKNNWRVNIQDEAFELEDFSQNADPALLYKHLTTKYPGANFKCITFPIRGDTNQGAQPWRVSPRAASTLNVMHPIVMYIFGFLYIFI